MELPADIIDDDSPTPTLVGVGDVIAGKYEVERVIGEGGMGVVVAAMHVDLQERVAIKLMLPSLVGHPESAQRFAREARATFGIKSEHVARLFDFGKLADGSPFMVMEYLEGETLAAQLNRSTHVDITRAVDIVLEACVGVADAHRLGIIHRDLKPENLFLAATADERVVVKVLDFGISKANLKELSPTRTEGGMGTPAYAAPEQLRCAGDAGPCADIWSMGVVLFELLAGRLPFLAGSFAEMCAAVLTQRPPHPREIRADIPEALDAIVMRCLEVEPEARYQSIVELARALGPFASIDGKALVARLESRSSRSGESSSDRIPLTTLLGGARVVPLPDTQEAPPGDTAADAASGQGATTGAPDAGEEPRPLDDSLVGCAADRSPVPVLTRTRLRIVAARRASLLAAAAAALVLLGGALMGPDGDGDVSALAAASTLDAGPHRPRGDASDRVTSDQVLATERLLQENAVLQQEGRQARRDDQPSALERTIAEDGRDVASGGDVPADDGAAADAAAPPAPPSAPSSVVDPGPAPKSTAPRAVRSDGPTGRRAPRAVPVFDGFGGRK